MLDILILSSLQCEDAKAIIARAKAHENLNNKVKTEIVETLKSSVLEECNWDAND